DVADLSREVGGHEVDAVGQVLPGARHAAHVRLAAELALGAHLPRHAGPFGGASAQLFHHGVDGVLQLQDLALHVHRDLPRQVAVPYTTLFRSDVADLSREVGGHEVDAVGQVLPGARHAAHVRLAAELALGAHLPRHA